MADCEEQRLGGPPFGTCLHVGEQWVSKARAFNKWRNIVKSIARIVAFIVLFVGDGATGADE